MTRRLDASCRVAIGGTIAAGRITAAAGGTIGRMTEAAPSARPSLSRPQAGLKKEGAR